jgi:hypothetical protein
MFYNNISLFNHIQEKPKYENNTSNLTPGALPLKSWDSLLPSMINKKQLHQQILLRVVSAKQVLSFS